jgi:hypothetical protein
MGALSIHASEYGWAPTDRRLGLAPSVGQLIQKPLNNRGDMLVAHCKTSHRG